MVGRNKSSGGAGHQAASGPITSYEGEVLRIPQVTKKHMGIYFCIASNGILPSVSKRVTVTVLCKLRRTSAPFSILFFFFFLPFSPFPRDYIDFDVITFLSLSLSYESLRR